MPEIKLRKNQTIPFMDTNQGSGSYAWNRIKRSTIFALNPNPQTSEEDYISYETPVTEITSYSPELPQEVACYAGDPIYEFIAAMFYDLPVGSGVKCPVMVCFPPNGDNEQKAWVMDETTVTLGEWNAVDGKISFTLNLGGDVKRGKYEISSSGEVTFTEGTFNKGTFSPKE